MDYEITEAVAHRDHTVSITWSDGAHGGVDFAPFIARGALFDSLRDPEYFVHNMAIMDRGIGLTWPNELDFSADGLRRDAKCQNSDGEGTTARVLQAGDQVTRR